jgi:hypothetical protein
VYIFRLFRHTDFMKIASSGLRALFRSTPRFRVPPAGAAGLAVLCAALLSGCGQEPGQTGLDYVEKQGIRISAPLYHLSFDDLPVDSVFASEVPLNHYGESLLVVGRESGYMTRARLGFQITTEAQRDSLAHGLHLRLSAVPLATLFGGRDYLRASVRGRDTLTLLVESFSWPDSTDSFSDSLSLFHRQILLTPAPFSTLDPRYKERDTIRVLPSAAYPDTAGGGGIQDSSQAGSLPNLWKRLRTGGGSDTARRWAVYLEVSPLTAADSGMFRFDLRAIGASDADRRKYLTGLWLGRYSKDSLSRVGALLAPYMSSNGFTATPATNYETRFSGSSTRSMLYGVSRGVHLRINRDTLLARIRLKLNALNPGDSTLGNRLLGSNPSGTFDRRFFVPYAAVRLPVDHTLTRVEGPFALDMSVTSDVDSLPDGSDFRDDIAVATGDSLKLPVQGGGAYADIPVDTLVVSYRRHAVDSSLRQVFLRWTQLTTVADTFTLYPDGRSRELGMRRHTGWTQSSTLNVKPGAAQLRIEVYFNVASVAESRHILDSAGNSLTSASDLKGRYWRPGADSLNVRVTRGLRNLLNRVHTPGTGIAPDLFLRGVDRAVFDTASVSGSYYRRVPYPVFGEIDFKRAGNGRLEVGLDLYLYPLEAGQ